MFAESVVYKAAHAIYMSEFGDTLERLGGSFPLGTSLYTAIDSLSPAEHDPIIRPLLAKIDEALGASFNDVFGFGGIIEKSDQVSALGDLLLGACGYGKSIHDDYSEAWARGCQSSGIQGELPYDEMTEYTGLASRKLDAASYPPEPMEGNKPNRNYEPIIATAFAWHRGQESALYAFASTRTVQSERHRTAILAEVARNLAWHNSNPEQEPGDVEKLRRLLGAVRSAPPGTRFFCI